VQRGAAKYCTAQRCGGCASLVHKAHLGQQRLLPPASQRHEHQGSVSARAGAAGGGRVDERARVGTVGTGHSGSGKWHTPVCAAARGI
jgi:hypothetical protein